MNLCLVHFMLVYTYQNSDNDKFYNLVGVSVVIGNKILNRDINKLRFEYIKEKNNISYSTWFEIWKKKNPSFNDVVDDSLKSVLGCKILDILFDCEMLDKKNWLISWP